MPGLDQEIDSIIAEEGITDAIPAAAPDEEVAPVEEAPVEEQPETSTEETPEETPEQKPADEAPVVEEQKVETPAQPEVPVTETIEQAKSFINGLNLTQDKVFDESGNPKAFEDVVPAGAFLASQLEPIKVTDKDGKEHEFMLISDVEKAFPDGFEAKNNLEQMRFQQAILANESAFAAAIKTYEGAKEEYTKETNAIVQSRGENERIGNEYRAMADAGLVPKIEGDANDPRFLESPAVKTLNGILEFMDTTNKDLAAKGLGQITSVYVAKQLMDQQAGQEKKTEKKEQIKNERNEVASLSSSGTPSGDRQPQKSYSHVPLSRLADEIIASEGLK